MGVQRELAGKEVAALATLTPALSRARERE